MPDWPITSPESRKRILFRKSCLVSRGSYCWPPFFPEGSRQLKLFWASRAICGLESASSLFSHVGIVRVIKREDPGDQESPAPISDQGLFFPGPAENGTVYGIPNKGGGTSIGFARWVLRRRVLCGGSRTESCVRRLP
jgi:hypothetical protein